MMRACIAAKLTSFSEQKRSQSSLSAGLCAAMVSVGTGTSSNEPYSCPQNTVPQALFRRAVSPYLRSSQVAKPLRQFSQ